MDRLLFRLPASRPDHRHRATVFPERPDHPRDASREAAERLLLHARAAEVGDDPGRAEQGRRARRARRLGPRDRRRASAGCRLDQAALLRPFASGRLHRRAVSGRRLHEPLRHRRGRRCRPDEPGRSDVGRLYALRAGRGHRDHAQVLGQQGGPAARQPGGSVQHARADRCLPPVRKARHVSPRGSVESDACPRDGRQVEGSLRRPALPAARERPPVDGGARHVGDRTAGVRQSKTITPLDSKD